MENRDVWAPVTPEKPVEQQSNPVPVGMQQNQEDQEGAGDENWQDLLGIYTDVLQDESCGLPPAWNPNSCIGVNQVEPPIDNFAPASTNIGPAGVVGLQNRHGVSSGETGNTMLPCSSSSAGLVGVNHWHCGIPDVAPVDKYRGFDQDAGNAGSYLQNVGDAAPPRKVNSLAELLGIGNSLNSPAAVKKAVQNQDIGGYNLQQMPSSKYQFLIDLLFLPCILQL